MKSSLTRTAPLAAILLTAAALRFTALGTGLRHKPHVDERYFVDNVCLMLSQGDLDQRFYEYPGLFFYLLSPALAVLRPGPTPTAAEYLAARGVVAAFGVGNVLLLYLFGSRVAGRGAALLAATLLAVSPVDVQTCHSVRPDVALASFVLLALMAFRTLGEDPSADLRSGVALGAAVALKFTGALLVPSYLVHRLLAPGRRVRGALLAGLVSAVTFVLLSPYAVIHLHDFLEDARAQVTYHYERHGADGSPLGMLLTYAAIWPKALGWPGAALAVAGLAWVRREWRAWAGLLVLPLTTLLVFSTQEYRFDRHMVPSLGIVALLAGVALDALAQRARVAAAAATLLAIALPLGASVAYLRGISIPGTRDLALDWIDARVPRGARIVSAVDGFGLDRQRFEVLEVKRVRPQDRPQALEGDVIVTAGSRDEAALADVPAAFVALPASSLAGPPVRVRFVTPDLQVRYTLVSLDSARLRAAPNAGGLDALRDGRVDTLWEAPPRPRKRRWLEVVLPYPVLLGRVELALGDRPKSAARGVRLMVSEDGAMWKRLAALPGRPPVKEQLGPMSRVLVFPPVRARGLRILATAGGGGPWAVAELRLYATGAR